MICLNIKHFINKFTSLAVAFSMLAVATVMSGCSLDDFLSTNTDSSETESQPKATAPAKTTDENLFGFDSINDEAVKILYGQIEKFTNKTTVLPFTIDCRISERQLSEAIQAYKNDHPEKFWLKSNCTYVARNENTTVYLQFTMEGDELESNKEAFDQKVDEIVANAPQDATQLELEKYAHDYIVENCEYNSNAADDEEIAGNTSDAYGAIIEGSAICEGYARAFSLLCRELGIDCTCVAGVGDKENHMWNCAKLDGEWYQVDVTWDDTESASYDESFAYYIYFNLCDDTMYKNHTPSKLYEELSDEEYNETNRDANMFVPQCAATQYRYGDYHKAVLYDVNDGSEITEEIANAASEQDEFMFLTIDSSLDFEAVSNQVIYDGYLAEWINSANLQNLYINSINSETTVYTLSNENLLVVKLEYN